MRGDFTRTTFERAKSYTRVLMQQGRLQVDADWNEHADITLDTIRQTAVDLIGPHAGPHGDVGFRIGRLDRADFGIGAGRYYVDGILCECTSGTTYATQPSYAVSRPSLEGRSELVVYLDVWEREATVLDDPDIAESALGGEDTSLRTKLVWRVVARPPADIAGVAPHVMGAFAGAPAAKNTLGDSLRETLTKARRPRLTIDAGDPREDVLLRLEIHREEPDDFRIKSSRQNGSTERRVAVSRVAGGLKVATYGRTICDGQVAVGSWLELLTDREAAEDEPGLLLKIARVRQRVYVEATEEYVDELYVTEVPPPSRVEKYIVEKELDGTESARKGCRARYWATVERISLGQETKLAIPDIARVHFDDLGSARHGDAWSVPIRNSRARTRIFESAAPSWPTHHFAPLAVIGNGGQIADLRREFKTLATLV